MSLDDLIPQLRASSVSDTGVYRGVCAAAAEHQQVFEQFRRLPGYTRILEHVTQEQGQAYLDEIKRLNDRLLQVPSWFAENDKYGSPVQFDYEGIGLVSPTTLRYVKVAAELQNMFGRVELSDAHVIEVGGGYGGQARILKTLFQTAQYTIIDLPEPLALAKRYLSAYSMSADFVDATHLMPDDVQGDLFLSNYALTECTPAVMAQYCGIASALRMGYITGNAQEKLLFELLPQARRLDEVPLTGPGNFICVWP